MAGISFRKLILGDHPFIPSHASYKRVVMTTQLGILTIIVCIAFSLMEVQEDRTIGIAILLGCAGLAFISLILNRVGKNYLAKIILTVAVNITVYLFSESESLEIGLYLFFMLSSIGAIAMFGVEEPRTAFFFVIFSVALFFLSLYTDLTVIPKVQGSVDYVTMNIVINFLVSVSVASGLVFFLIRINFSTESILEENERQLSVKNTELTKLNTELDRFVYSTSHDLRSPISSILGLINLTKYSNDPAEIKQYLEMMEGRLANLNKFIKDISDYSRNTRTEIYREHVNVKKVVHEIVEGLRYYPGRENLKVKITMEDTFGFETDPTRLQIILSNLIANSIKYTDDGKPNSYLIVSAERTPSLIQLKVEDNGIGIDPGYLPRVFDMFFQAHKKSEGSGLGLYIVKESVAKLNGTISVKSELGKGSQFLVSFPLN